MAKPRIFISSTYFDLRNIRSDLERYIKERNYDAILNEKGHIAYLNEKRLEEYCYKEIDNCDILISIIGGRFGSSAHESDGYSISQTELKTAFDKGKQVYIFIEKTVLHEYRTYEKNKDDPELLKKIRFSAVDNLKIYEFLDEVFSLPINNQFTGFETSNDIIHYLQEQWASLFQSLLQDASKQQDFRLIEEMRDSFKTLKQLVTYLANEKEKGHTAINEILFANHPVFYKIKTALNSKMRIYFTSLEELHNVMSTFGFQFDEVPFDMDKYEWQYKNKTIAVACSLFTQEGKLIPIDISQWDDSNVTVKVHQPKFVLDDDLPF